jgi:hypothetical protein
VLPRAAFTLYIILCQYIILRQYTIRLTVAAKTFGILYDNGSSENLWYIIPSWYNIQSGKCSIIDICFCIFVILAFGVGSSLCCGAVCWLLRLFCVCLMLIYPLCVSAVRAASVASDNYRFFVANSAKHTVCILYKNMEIKTAVYYTAKL